MTTPRIVPSSQDFRWSSNGANKVHIETDTGFLVVISKLKYSYLKYII